MPCKADRPGLLFVLQSSDQRIREMQQRVEATEQRQNTIVNFLARVAQNPTVLQQMVSVAQISGLQRLEGNTGRGEGRMVVMHVGQATNGKE
jgi:hypothetical protein